MVNHPACGADTGGFGINNWFWSDLFQSGINRVSNQLHHFASLPDHIGLIPILLLPVRNHTCGNCPVLAVVGGPVLPAAPPSEKKSSLAKFNE